MKKAYLDPTIRNLSFQRNVMIVLTIFLALSTTVLSIAQFLRNERIIVVPPTVQKSFWVDNTSVSPSYVEQLGLFIGQLLFTKSYATSENQRNIVLKHTHAAFAGIVNKKLKEEEIKMKAEGTSYVFFPLSVIVDPKSYTVSIFGDRTTYLKEKKLSSKKETYLLSFAYSGGRLLLTGVNSKESKND